ncbi:hypothetical protein BSKO_00343 [Bryopsis sp. KO-2023]|nr:hypothetical protein BSKO_00343 [Bryopsis sp. KO-2023]
MSLRIFSLLAVVALFAIVSNQGAVAQDAIAEAPTFEISGLGPATSVQRTDAEKEDDVVKDLAGEFDDQASGPALAPSDDAADLSPGASVEEGSIEASGAGQQFQIKWVLGVSVGLLALLF